MFRLFNRLPKGLEPMAEIFRKHVEEEGELASEARSVLWPWHQLKGRAEGVLAPAPIEWAGQSWFLVLAPAEGRGRGPAGSGRFKGGEHHRASSPCVPSPLCLPLAAALAQA